MTAPFKTIVCLLFTSLITLAETAVAPLPSSTDLRPEFTKWNLPSRRQGRRPTCSAFAVTGALEFALARHRGHGEVLSVEFLNWASNDAIGQAYDGGFFSDLWKGYLAHGICTEKEMPYAPTFDPAKPPATNIVSDAKTNLALGLQLHWIKRWNVRTGLKEQEFLGIKQTLTKGWPVCGGFRWPNHEKWSNGILQMAATNEVYDGHSLLLVGYRDEPAQPGGGVFVFRNSSGGRDGQMPYAYAQTFMNDAAWIDSESNTAQATAPN